MGNTVPAGTADVIVASAAASASMPLPAVSMGVTAGGLIRWLMIGRRRRCSHGARAPQRC